MEHGLESGEDGGENALEDFEDGGDEVCETLEYAGHVCGFGMCRMVKAWLIVLV